MLTFTVNFNLEKNMKRHLILYRNDDEDIYFFCKKKNYSLNGRTTTMMITKLKQGSLLI